MFIQTETTPNPMTLKFLPGRDVLAERTAFYTGADQAKESPLAEALFRIQGVNAVFFGSDFITVTKNADASWDVLKPGLLSTIMEHFVAGKPVMREAGTAPAAASNASEEDDDVIRQIKELIETRVRPAVAQDGGDIVYHGFKDGIVQLELHGACSGCPSSSATLKQGIENMLKHYVPEVMGVEAV